MFVVTKKISSRCSMERQLHNRIVKGIVFKDSLELVTQISRGTKVLVSGGHITFMSRGLTKYNE